MFLSPPIKGLTKSGNEALQEGLLEEKRKIMQRPTHVAHQELMLQSEQRSLGQLAIREQ